MTSNHVPNQNMPAVFNPYMCVYGYGLGFWVDTTLEKARWIKTQGQYGWGGAVCTWFWIVLAEEFIGILTTQSASEHSARLTEVYRNLCYQAIED